MRKQGSGKSNLELPALRVTGANSMSRKHRKSFIALWLIAASLLTSASAQETNKSKPEQAPTPATTKTVINLWPGVAPGSEQWKQPETALGSGGMKAIVNVSTPTLTAYLPDPSTATGTAVIIAPGGGFISLSINSEGHDVAKWLVARGIAAIVLKYRVVQIEGQDAAQLGRSARAAFMAQMSNHALVDEDGKYGIADGIQAVKVVRAHAAEWGISPDRVVFMGFSAGGMIADFTAIQPDARPNYAAPIYGAPISAVPAIPQGLPPFFMAMAQDDTLAGTYIVAFYDALKAAGYKPEFHIFSSGGHGWGMRKQGKSSDHWIDEFYYWLEAQGLTRPLK
ncbi:MAG: alpha/beta hydrolase fold domain-containing protein [Acidobacteriia bacterium]|nr:alpha/beta hydrolase fold domain-containing protein [Terriglobia bacterium]